MGEGAFPAATVAAAAAAAGQYLRVEAEGVMLRCAETALSLAEQFCARTWIRRGHEEVLGIAPAWQRLAHDPVASITAATGLPAEGAPFALPVAAYAVDIEADGIGRVRVLAPGAAGRVTVRYVAGAGAWDDLPPPVASGVVLLAAHLFEHREGEAMPPAAVSALWRPFRRGRL